MIKNNRTVKKVLRGLGEDHTGMERQIDGLQEALIHLRFEGKASLGRNVKQAQKMFSLFNQELLRHMSAEEEVLFPFLEKYIPKFRSLV